MGVTLKQAEKVNLEYIGHLVMANGNVQVFILVST